MGLSDRSLRQINHYLVLASGAIAVAFLFYFKPESFWWWACWVDIGLFAYKIAAKIDLAMMERPKAALAPKTRGPWRAWFAWYPVQVDLGTPSGRFKLPGDWIYLQKILRRWASDETGTPAETHYAYPSIATSAPDPEPHREAA